MSLLNHKGSRWTSRTFVIGFCNYHGAIIVRTARAIENTGGNCSTRVENGRVKGSVQFSCFQQPIRNGYAANLNGKKEEWRKKKGEKKGKNNATTSFVPISVFVANTVFSNFSDQFRGERTNSSREMRENFFIS